MNNTSYVQAMEIRTIQKAENLPESHSFMTLGSIVCATQQDEVDVVFLLRLLCLAFGLTKWTSRPCCLYATSGGVKILCYTTHRHFIDKLCGTGAVVRTDSASNSRGSTAQGLGKGNLIYRGKINL